MFFKIILLLVTTNILIYCIINYNEPARKKLFITFHHWYMDCFSVVQNGEGLEVTMKGSGITHRLNYLNSSNTEVPIAEVRVNTVVTIVLVMLSICILFSLLIFKAFISFKQHYPTLSNMNFYDSGNTIFGSFTRFFWLIVVLLWDKFFYIMVRNFFTLEWINMLS